MARLFTRTEALAQGVSDDALKWALHSRNYVRLAQGVYFEGDRPPKLYEQRLAKAMTLDRRVSGELAASLHRFDGFDTPRDGNYENVPLSTVSETPLGKPR